MSTVHIIGAGVAGLAAAVRLAGAGRRVVVHEAAPAAGGRCRSYHDPVLDRRIDNGNHLLLSANHAALSYLADCGAADSLVGPDDAVFPFVDLDTGERWTLRPNRGRLPWWIFVAGRRIPGTRAADYLSGLGLALAGAGETVGDRVPRHHPLYRRFWEPLSLAVLNADPSLGAARLLWATMRETFALGAGRCLPRVARDGLAASFVDPALATLRAHGAEVRLSTRLNRLAFAGSTLEALVFGGETVALAAGDRVVLAVPPAVAASLVPGLTVPEGEGHPIVNAHYRLETPATLPGGSPFLGIVGGDAHWLFARDDVVSVTVSDARALVDHPADDLAARLWHDVARAIGRPGAALPPARIVKERRATFVQTPDNLNRRPAARTGWPQLLLAGDWTATGVPATIEGAIRSGHAAAAALGV